MSKTELVRQCALADKESYTFQCIIDRVEEAICTGQQVSDKTIDGLMICYSLRDMYDRTADSILSQLRTVRA